MGIQGLSTFMHKNDFFEINRLHDTILIIDGFNLICQNFFNHQQITKDHMYGGDYDSLSQHVRHFFQNLQKCNVQPVMIFDGSIDPSMEKLKTVLRRSEIHLNTAYRIYEHNYYIESILPLLSDSVYCLQLERLSIPVYQTCYEADQTIIQIAFDLKCPILSNDSDFLLYKLPGGVVNLQSLFDYNLVVHRETSYNYMKCRFYKIDNLKRLSPKLNFDLIQTAGFILGNDYVDSQTVKMFIRRITQNKHRQQIIHDVFIWISKHDMLKSLLEHLSNLLKTPNHELIKVIQKHFILLKDGSQESLGLETYFEKNIEKLCIQNVDIPVWMQSKFTNKKIDARLLSIFKAHVDWCRPLVEDFSYDQSSYETVKNPLKYVYAILRSQDKNVPRIKRYSRKNKEFKAEVIMPSMYLDGELLPKLKDIENLSIQQRESFFFGILGIDSEVLQRIVNYLENQLKFICSFDYSLQIPFSSMIFTLIFMLRNFSGHVWIEFVYSIYMNIWFTGYLCSESNPIFLKFDSHMKKMLHDNLSQFSSLPVLSCSKVFMPRVVHFYNAYQACLKSINFLSDILNLKDIFNVDIMLCGLKGTFIYNLTTELSSRPKPLLYIQQLLGRQKFKPMDIFLELLDFLVDHTDRNLLAKNKKLDDQDIVPISLRAKIDFSVSQEKKYFLRAFDFTNKKTHVNSQKMKLKK